MKGHYIRIFLIFMLPFMMATSVFAQSFIVKGTIRGEADNEPLIGVSVFIKGTSQGTISDANGNYSLNITGESATLVFSYIGYSVREYDVSSATGTLDVVLTEDVSQLEEVVITGLASSIKRSNLANSVATVSAKELTGTTNQSTMDGALYGKFKGAQIRSNSGAPGGGMSIRLRGVTSIFGDQQPLFIVDGIYVDNSTVSLGTNVVTAAAGGGNTSTNQDDASNRIADIDPEDIENIEILKGASAAAIYGNRAAGGVVIITTKRGKSGKARVTFDQTVGLRRPITLLGDRGWDAAKVESVFGAADRALFEQNGNFDYESEIYDNTRVSSTSRVTVSGGDGKTDYFLGVTYKNEDGLVDNTGYEKGSLRLNIGHRFNDWLDVYVTSNYINSTSDRGLFNNGNTNTTVGYALAFTKPWVDLFPDENGIYPANNAVGSNVLETIALVTNRENVNRFIGGGTMNVRILNKDNMNLKAVLSAGIDQYTLRTTGEFPQQLSFYRDPASLQGVLISGSTVNTNYNLNAIFVHNWFPNSSLSFSTQAGLLMQDFDLNTVITTSDGIIGSQTSLDQATNVSVYQNREPARDKGFFIQEEFNWEDKIIATAGIRADKSTNNGDPNEFFIFPKASMALNLHNFDFWGSSLITTLKPRVAYGEAGRSARFRTRSTILDATTIDGTSGLFPNFLRGNPEIKPETQIETEFGIDIGFLDGMINFDFTYYIKTVEDLIFEAQIPTTTGFTRRGINGGELENKGFEMGINATPVRQGDWTWNTTLNFWKNQSEITQLDIPAFNTGGFAASLGQYRIQEGKSATQIVGTFDPSDPDFVDTDGDGFRVYGDAEPDFNMSWQNSIVFKNFELSFLLHWKNGGDGINLSTLLYDLGGLTWDYDATSLDPNGAEVNGDYRLNQWFAGNSGPWIEDNGYIRLREIGLFYTLPEGVIPNIERIRVGVSGRNLWNSFDYNSYDPEVSNFGNNVLANTVEVTPYPTSKFVNFHLGITF